MSGTLQINLSLTVNFHVDSKRKHYLKIFWEDLHLFASTIHKSNQGKKIPKCSKRKVNDSCFFASVSVYKILARTLNLILKEINEVVRQSRIKYILLLFLFKNRVFNYSWQTLLHSFQVYPTGIRPLPHEVVTSLSLVILTTRKLRLGPGVCSFSEADEDFYCILYTLFTLPLIKQKWTI